MPAHKINKQLLPLALLNISTTYNISSSSKECFGITILLLPCAADKFFLSTRSPASNQRGGRAAGSAPLGRHRISVITTKSVNHCSKTSSIRFIKQHHTISVAAVSVDRSAYSSTITVALTSLSPPSPRRHRSLFSSQLVVSHRRATPTDS